jgi:hypothetical protein
VSFWFRSTDLDETRTGMRGDGNIGATVTIIAAIGAIAAGIAATTGVIAAAIGMMTGVTTASTIIRAAEASSSKSGRNS